MENLASFVAFGVPERVHHAQSHRIISMAIFNGLKPNILAWSLLGRLMSTDGHIKASEKEQREFFQEQYLPSLEMMKEATDNVPIGFWLCEPLSAEAATEAAEVIRLIDAQGPEFKDLPTRLGIKTIRLQVSLALRDNDKVAARHSIELNEMVQREAKLQTGEVVSYLIDVIEQMLPPRDQRPSVVEDALIKLRGGTPLNPWQRVLRFLGAIEKTASRILKH